MDDQHLKYITPFRSKENYYDSTCTTMDRTTLNTTSFEEKRNYCTPKKYYSMKFQEIINEAPKKTFAFESKTNHEIEPLNNQLFKDDDISLYEKEFSTDYHLIQKINGALRYYRLDNIFILQGFLEWMITFDDIDEILYSFVKTFIKGFNEKSILMSKYFNKGTFIEIIGHDLSSLNTTLSVLDNEINCFSDEFDTKQIEIKDEKIFISVQGKCKDKSEVSHPFRLSYKISLIVELLRDTNALLKDVLRGDYIKIKIF